MLKKIFVNQHDEINEKLNSEKLNSAEKYQSIIISLPLYNNDIVKPFNNKNQNNKFINLMKKLLFHANSIIDEKGLLFIYGSPIQLIKTYELLPETFKFKHWIALNFADNFEEKTTDHLRHSHIGILMLSKGTGSINIDTKNTKVPYQACSVCKRNIKDWGGKKHLMNIRGAGLSDVWNNLYKVKGIISDPDIPKIKLHLIDVKHLSFKYNFEEMPQPILDRLLSLLIPEERNILLIQCKSKLFPELNKFQVRQTDQSKIRNIKFINMPKDIPKDIENKIILGDSIAVMENLVKKYPNGVFDLVFADPPYNLKKDYKIYNDNKTNQDYINWCNKWLELCVRLTKPDGNILILNLPKWGLEHAKFLNNIAYLQNWIVWDALSIPKGKIMPAHYALLSFTKQPLSFTFNKLPDIESIDYCSRHSCIKSRKKVKLSRTTQISDIWWDIHRIKHKKYRDDHPCQLPEKLMERIILLYTNVNDLVFDPFCGAGTTAICALKLKRKYTTIEINNYYLKIAKNKLKQYEQIKNSNIYKRTF